MPPCHSRPGPARRHHGRLAGHRLGRRHDEEEERHDQPETRGALAREPGDELRLEAERSIEYGAHYAAAAYEGNLDCRVFAFANYPDIGKQQDEIDQWEERWLSPDYRRGRANFEKVAEGISAKFPDRPPVRIIPVGEVMYRLHQHMKQGKVPGYKHIAELYADGVHLNSEGEYVEAVTHYATVFQDDPHDCITSGLRFWKGPYGVDKAFAEVVWDVVWEVVTSDPNTGVKSASE